MAEWHHWLDGRESVWTPGDGDGQGHLACWDSWGRKESDTTEWLNWTELNWTDGSMRERFVSIQLQWAVYDFIREHVQTPQKLKLCIISNILSEDFIYKLYGWFVLSYNIYLIKQIWFPLLSLQFPFLFNISHELSYRQRYKYFIIFS